MNRIPPPLPKASRDACTGGSGNPSLIWDRYLRVFQASYHVMSTLERKPALDDFVDQFAKANKAQSLLRSHHRRLSRLRGVRSLSLKTTAPLLIGAGADHPTETGLTFDPLLGLPWVPGSALKGLTRAWCRWAELESEQVGEQLGQAPPGAGSASQEPSRQGRVAFVGAWPIAWPKLQVEVLTPHHPEYQQDQARPAHARKRLPNYTNDPMPVNFLALQEGTPMMAYLLPIAPAEAADLDLVSGWLGAALEHLGVGAKTAAGFGRMSTFHQPPP